jgi:N6-adenosine-specific RNA methylase IME4
MRHSLKKKITTWGVTRRTGKRLKTGRKYYINHTLKRVFIIVAVSFSCISDVDVRELLLLIAHAGWLV